MRSELWSGGWNWTPGKISATSPSTAIWADAAKDLTRVRGLACKFLFFAKQNAEKAAFATIAAILAVVTLVARLVPARRARRVRPLIALRHE